MVVHPLHGHPLHGAAADGLQCPTKLRHHADMEVDPLQNSPFQLGLADTVGGAHRLVRPVGGADEISVGLVAAERGLSDHVALAVPAAHQAGQRVDGAGAGGLAGVLLLQPGGQLKILLADNGLMGPLYPNPSVGRALDYGPDLVVGGGALALGHGAQIDLVRSCQAWTHSFL